MWACWWVRVWCVCARARFVAESKDCYKIYFPPNSSNTPLWKALRSPYSSCEVAQTRGHVIEARC